MKGPLYIAGPMTGYPSYNFPAFFEAEKQLTTAGYAVLNPARVDVENGFDPDNAQPMTEAEYARIMRRDLYMVLRAGGIALLPGWDASLGANIEVQVAGATGLPVGTVEAWLSQGGEHGEG